MQDRKCTPGICGKFWIWDKAGQGPWSNISTTKVTLFLSYVVPNDGVFFSHPLCKINYCFRQTGKNGFRSPTPIKRHSIFSMTLFASDVIKIL